MFGVFFLLQWKYEFQNFHFVIKKNIFTKKIHFFQDFYFYAFFPLVWLYTPNFWTSFEMDISEGFFFFQKAE